MKHPGTTIRLIPSLLLALGGTAQQAAAAENTFGTPAPSLTLAQSALLQPVAPAGLLPTDAARALLEQDPGVAAARSGLEVAMQTADMLDASPYEWTPNAMLQQRRVKHDDRFTEWNVGIDRTLRLPAKAAADRKTGAATLEEAQAGYALALHQAARDLMMLRVDWLAAERALHLADVNLRATQANLDAVDKRYRAGDASQLDVSIARAELADQRRAQNDAKMQADTAWIHLSTRFPGLERHIEKLALPEPLPGNPLAWRGRLVSVNNEMKMLGAQLRRQESLAERARAEKTPDPTVGFFTASEQGGNDRISGISISIPISGRMRSARSLQALSEVNVLHQQAELKRRQIEADTVSAVSLARGAYDSMLIAREGADAMRDNADKVQRAYALGEADLQTLMTARRQAIAAIGTALQAQVDALKAYYGLLIDAHLVWGLENDVGGN